MSEDFREHWFWRTKALRRELARIIRANDNKWHPRIPKISFRHPLCQWLPENLKKPEKCDGTDSILCFLAQLEVCARENRWSGHEKVDFLCCEQEKAATQLLWDFSASEMWPMSNLSCAWGRGTGPKVKLKLLWHIYTTDVREKTRACATYYIRFDASLCLFIPSRQTEPLNFFSETEWLFGLVLTNTCPMTFDEDHITEYGHPRDRCHSQVEKQLDSFLSSQR